MATDFDLTHEECARALARVRWAARRIENSRRRIQTQQAASGAAMRELRELAGVSVEALSAWIGIEPPELEEMEDGRRFYGEGLARRAVACLADAPPVD